MRWLATCAAGFAFLVVPPTLAPTLMPAALACAGTIINACGKFSFWVPDNWRAYKGDATSVEQSVFENKDGNLYVTVGPLEDKTAILSDEDVTEFIGEQFDDVKITSDKKDTLEKFQVRLLEGTGKDEGDPIVFKALALDTGSDAGVLMVIVSGDQKYMDRAENQATTERILRSLRPQ